MKEIECDECGETLVRPEAGEYVINGTLVTEHMDDTGHQVIPEPTLEERWENTMKG